MAASKKKYYESRGSRKRATARIRLYEGKETSIVNEVPIDDYFKGSNRLIDAAVRPIVAAGLADKVFFSAKVFGGGNTGQSGAIRHGVARALVKFDEDLRPVMKKESLLTRDSREVERKKYFLRKARKRPQFSKR